MEVAQNYRDPALYIENTNEYEMSLCKAVYHAYMELEREDGPHYSKNAPREIIMKVAMQKGRGALNPYNVSTMINDVYDYYYELRE